MMNFLLGILPIKTVYAHCDIPCGIYDPHEMQLAAHTVIRMVNMLDELKPSVEEPPFDERKKIISQIARLTKVKEEHAEKIKHEVRILWGDYFKEEHVEKFPELNNLVWETLKLASKTKQTIDLENAKKLLENTNKIAEIFFKTKDMEIREVKPPYPTDGWIVIQK